MKKIIKIFVLISVVAIMMLTLCVSSFASNIFGQVCGECGSDNLELRSEPSDGFCGEVYCKDCDYYCFDPQHEFSEGVCSYCGYVCDHSFGAWSVTSQATCTNEGVKARTCSECGKVEIGSISALGHSLGNRTYCSQTVYCANSGCNYKETGSCSFGAWSVTAQPTCTNEGVKARTCSECGKVETGSISALGHSYGSWEIETEAECEVEGYQARRCSTCDDIDYAVISATGHSYSSWQTVTSASCTSKGEQKRVCSECGKTETKSIAALGHKYVNNVCSVCGYGKASETTTSPDESTKDPNETTKAPNETTSTPVKDHEHNWSSWQKVDANKHSRSCQDSDCSAKETKSHEDKNTDGKCDVCNGMYLTEVPIEKMLGAVLGVVLVLGVVYLFSVIVKKSKE